MPLLSAAALIGAVSVLRRLGLLAKWFGSFVSWALTVIPGVPDRMAAPDELLDDGPWRH